MSSLFHCSEINPTEPLDHWIACAFWNTNVVLAVPYVVCKVVGGSGNHAACIPRPRSRLSRQHLQFQTIHFGFCFEVAGSCSLSCTYLVKWQLDAVVGEVQLLWKDYDDCVLSCWKCTLYLENAVIVSVRIKQGTTSGRVRTQMELCI